MATFDDVRRIALSLPETSERTGGHTASPQWRVKDKLFVWDRPLGKGDRAALGDDAPDGEILAARIDHEEVKRALIEQDPDAFFTIPHFDGYNAILVKLANIDIVELEEVVTDAWLLRAPAKLAKAWLEHLEEHPPAET